MTFAEYMAKRFFGRLAYGKHEPDGVACVLEAVSQWRGLAWTDDPGEVLMPDLRPLNDGPWPTDASRTAALVPLVEALADWDGWSLARRQAWVARVAIETVRRIIADLPGLPADVRADCRLAADLGAARWAAEDAAVAAGEAARWAASASEAAKAAEAARWAAWAAGSAARWAAGEAARWAASASAGAAEVVLGLACQIWIDAAREIVA